MVVSSTTVTATDTRQTRTGRDRTCCKSDKILILRDSSHKTAVSHDEATTIRVTSDGFVYRDLNGNGQLDPYEDPRLPVEQRVEDLLQRMTVQEKAGLLFQPIIEVGPNGKLAESPTAMSALTHSELVCDKLISHFNVLSITDVADMVRWQNTMQRLAASTRLGIPITFSSDPRHSFTQNVGASLAAGVYSKWCENLGLAALRDPAMVARFAEIARQEYTALGIRAALHPTIDLATEPRWARQFNTFGQSADVTTTYLTPYIKGFQQDTLGPHSVACMAKHFPGGGAQKDGEDPHFPYGREQVYPGNAFEEHLRPFRKAIDLGVSAMMPYYSMPSGLVRNGESIEEVGFAFNRQIITGLLRNELGFKGVVCADWAVLNEHKMGQHVSEARAWGLEHASPSDRVARALEAGVDQFGGEYSSELVIQLVQQSIICESRLDQSVRRLLTVKFQLGLFDDPYVDLETALATVGCSEFREAGFEAQCRSMVVLKNAFESSSSVSSPQSPILPLRRNRNVYAPHIPAGLLRRYGCSSTSLDEAELAIMRLRAPWEPRSTYFLEDKYHAGRLDFPAEQLEPILQVCRKLPTIVDIYLDRPAILPEIAAESCALVANFGASDEALLAVLFGERQAGGKLPFEMPSSMEAVRASLEDVAGTPDPLFPFGFGQDL